MPINSNGQHDSSSTTLPPSTDESFPESVFAEALAFALAEAQRNWEREWQRALALMQAQAQAVVAQMRAEVLNQRSEAARVVAERLALVRDGNRGPPGEPGA